MFDLLKNWITSIVVIVMFMVLVDIILPSNSLKKYAKLVMGLIIIIVIISPIFNLLNKRVNIETVIGQYVDKYTAIDKVKSVNQSPSMEVETIKVFKENLKKKISESLNVSSNKKYEILDLMVFEDKNAENFLDVKTIVLKEEKQGDKIETISKITIGKTQSQDVYNWDNKAAKVLESKFNIKEAAIKFVK